MMKKEKNNEIKRPISFVSTDENGELTENSARRYFSVIGFAILAVVLIKDLLTLAVSKLLLKFAPDLLENYYVSLILSCVILYLVAMPIGAVILRRLPKATPLKSKFGALQWLCGFCIVFALIVAGNYVSQMSLTFIHLVRGKEVYNPVDAMVTNTPIPVQILFVAILAPIMEELFFRKLLCDKLLPLGEKYAVFVSATIFALAHGNFYQLFYAFLIGCFFAYVYVTTGKIRHSIIYHIIINLLGSVVAGWITSKLDLEVLMSGNTEMIIEWMINNIIPVIALLAYDFLMYGAALAGVILMIINHRKIKLNDGLLTPAKHARVSCVFMNFGVASAILYFALTLVYSLFV